LSRWSRGFGMHTFRLRNGLSLQGKSRETKGFYSSQKARKVHTRACPTTVFRLNKLEASLGIEQRNQPDDIKVLLWKRKVDMARSCTVKCVYFFGIKCCTWFLKLPMLELCAVKVACTVLRGRRRSNATLLPDYKPISSHPGIEE